MIMMKDKWPHVFFLFLNVPVALLLSASEVLNYDGIVRFLNVCVCICMRLHVFTAER